MYAGGDTLAGYDATSAAATAFAPIVGGAVYALAISGGRLGVGDVFRTVGADTGPVPEPPAPGPRVPPPHHP